MPAQLELGETTPLSLFRAAALENATRPCLLWPEGRLSYAEVDEASDALAVALLERGVEAGDRVGVFLQNQPEFVITLLGAWKAAGILVPINPMLKESELRYQLSDSGTRALVSDAALFHSVGAAAVAGTRVERVITTGLVAGTDSFWPLIDHSRGQRPPSVRSATSDAAYLVYTSGTTGRPKGAINTHANVAFSAEVYRRWMELESGDVVLGGAPLFHITGLLAGIAASHAAGCPLVLFGRFDAGSCLQAIETHRATFTVMAITAFLAMLAHPDATSRDLGSLAKVFSGGAPVAPATVERWEELSGAYIHNIYGLTETTSPSHATPLGARAPVDPALGALAVGVPVPSTDVRVVDPQTFEDVPAGAEGELLIAGPQVVPSYWQQPDATRALFIDGYLRTGDVGKMDERGYFYVVDRLKDMINASGYKVWPREVEDHLYQHPAVREAAVVGVPDAYRGETVKAYISLREGASAGPKEIIAFCRERMAAYKYPRQVEILAELPKTPTGKFLRRELRERGAGAQPMC